MRSIVEFFYSERVLPLYGVPYSRARARKEIKFRKVDRLGIIKVRRLIINRPYACVCACMRARAHTRERGKGPRECV